MIPSHHKQLYQLSLLTPPLPEKTGEQQELKPFHLKSQLLRHGRYLLQLKVYVLHSPMCPIYKFISIHTCTHTRTHSFTLK